VNISSFTPLEVGGPKAPGKNQYAWQLTCTTSLAVHAAATATSEKFPIVAVVVLLAVCLHWVTVVELVVMSVQKHAHPLAALGSPITPEVAVPPVPTLIVKAAVPLDFTIEGEVPNPDEMVGEVPEMRRLSVLPSTIL
jgi:hypothetical protein